MCVIGLDLSLASTGVAVANRNGNVGTFMVKTAPSKTPAETVGRIRHIYQIVASTVLDTKPKMAVIEGPSPNSRYGKPHERGGLWWRVAELCEQAGVPIAVVPPKTRAKYGTGNGNADKKMVLEAVRRTYPWVKVSGHDEADAVLLAAMGMRHLGSPVEEALTQPQLEAMDGAQWP